MATRLTPFPEGPQRSLAVLGLDVFLKKAVDGWKDRGRVSTIRAKPRLPDRTVTLRSTVSPAPPIKGTLTFDIYGYAYHRQIHVEGRVGA